MIALIEEAWIAVSIKWYELAIQQMGPLHPDLPANVVTVRDLKDQLNELRSKWGTT